MAAAITPPVISSFGISRWPGNAPGVRASWWKVEVGARSCITSAAIRSVVIKKRPRKVVREGG